MNSEFNDKTPVDVTKPVENPALLAAILAFEKSQTAEVQDRLTIALKSARFLVPFVGDDLTTVPGAQPGSVTIQPGGRLKFAHVPLSDGKPYMPVFTDAAEIQKWTKIQVHTLIFTVSDLHSLLQNLPNMEGAVVNVASLALVLKKTHLASLSKV